METKVGMRGVKAMPGSTSEDEQEVKPDSIPETISEATSGKTPKTAPETAPETTLGQPSKMEPAAISRVLVIDDFELMRSMLKNALADLGIDQVEEAEHGRAGKKMIDRAFASNHPYDVVFCDWNMPVMSGIQLLAELRAEERFRELPFVMVTAESEKQFVIHALTEGATDYIVKPISTATVRRKIEMLQRHMSETREGRDSNTCQGHDTGTRQGHDTGTRQGRDTGTRQGRDEEDR